MAEGDNAMKEKIHPNYQVITVRCVTCGSEYEMGSTSKNINVDTCANCHPFYTGQDTYTQAAGRVERFNKRYGINKDQK